MDQDYSNAVSFTNSYFALADGLVSGLESCLAENVVLDWFGKSIKGRTNVTAFMNTHKVNSRHVFNDIIPTENIGYNKKINRRNRRRKFRIQNDVNNGNMSIENQLSNESTPVSKIVSSGDRSRSSCKIDAEGNRIEENNLTFELHDDDVSTLFKLENIKSTNIEEIEQQISRITLEENLKMKSPGKKERKDVNGIHNNCSVESSMKFIEAHGEILFSKKSRRQSGWSECKSISSNSTQTWRKLCKLQIAYSSQQTLLQPFSFANNNTIELENSQNFTESQQKLPILDQITELSNNLVPNVNNFAGYFRNINIAKEEDSFFKNLGEYFSKNEAKKLGLIPRYINGKLIYQKINCDNHEESQRNFIFNNLIHVIIYEGRSRCKINLSQKFV